MRLANEGTKARNLEYGLAPSLQTLLGGVFKGVAQERWENTKNEEADELMSNMLSFEENIQDDNNEYYFLHFKALESAVRSLIYVAMTYTSLIPYLKGIHLTLNAWRPDCDEHGRKKRKKNSEPIEECGPPPKYVEKQLPD